jgi:hypothetical protein
MHLQQEDTSLLLGSSVALSGGAAVSIASSLPASVPARVNVVAQQHTTPVYPACIAYNTSTARCDEGVASHTVSLHLTSAQDKSQVAVQNSGAFRLTLPLAAAHGAQIAQVKECVWWDESARAWSNAGCTLVATTATHATCDCTHLSTFAVSARTVPASVRPTPHFASLLA